MPHIHVDNKEITFKIVYYGPGMSGKTTNLSFIHQSLAKSVRGEMISLDTEEERTHFFDFFPLELGTIEGYTIRFSIYTVPGQIHYEASRRLILDGADGVVYVADSQPHRKEDNLVSYKLMTDNILSYGLDPDEFPVVLQYNKRDCPLPIEIGTLERELGLPTDMTVLTAVATEGQGVMESIRAISRSVIERFHLPL